MIENLVRQDAVAHKLMLFKQCLNLLILLLIRCMLKHLSCYVLWTALQAKTIQLQDAFIKMFATAIL